MIVDVNPKAVLLAGAVLAALAVIGAYQGWERSSPNADVTAPSDIMAPTVNAVSAKQASPLAEPAAPVLTEAQIRTIARQEARAALNEGSGSSASEEAPRPSAPPPVVRTAPTPAPVQPQAPSAPAPAEGNQPPLF